jgi:predicted Ser/Thr protein kinase
VTSDHWQRVRDLFAATMDADAASRETALARESDPAVADEVRTLLAAHDRSDGFLERPAWEADPSLLADPADSLSGRDLGPYRVIREIGRGGMGVVYEAEDRRLRRRVALKALPREFTSDPSRRERLAREARAAASLSHPGIATVFAFEELEGERLVVSELVRGTSLREEIARGPLPLPLVRDTAAALADALGEAHRRGIIHRDLKPENVLRREDGQVKILDFGIARVPATVDSLTRLTEEGIRLGTPGYMAPEQLRGETADHRADIYALGVLIHEMATGTLPSGVASDLPPPLDEVVRRCLQPRAADRFASAAEVAAALRAAPRSRARWWWEFHQLAISALLAAVVPPAWSARPWIPAPWGSIAFLTVLGLAVVAIAMRIHLLFVWRVAPATSGGQRRRVRPLIAAIEIALAALLAVLAAALAGPHDGVAAWFAAAAMLLAVAVLIIEPATTGMLNA